MILTDIGQNINIAHFVEKTNVFGLTPKSVIYLQGCLKNCKNCLAPQWRDIKKANLYTIDYLVKKILLMEDIEGVVLSGGEPFLQAYNLIKLTKKIKKLKDLGFICYTGYNIEEIKNNNVWMEFFNLIDMVITGEYIHELNNNKGLRGSTNQKIFFNTDRYKNEKEIFLSSPREVEVIFKKDYVILHGIPSKEVSMTLFRVFNKNGKSI